MNIENSAISKELHSALKGLEPQLPWEYFNQLRQIPRNSKEEGQVKEWVKSWATEHDFRVTEDATGNLCVHVPASEGCEGAPVVSLQGHMDMVCDKELNSPHDFGKDAIDLEHYTESDEALVTQYGEKEFVKAKGTTLGMDNGGGIAQYMAAAIDPSCRHPALQLVLTVDEEGDLTGAENLDPVALQLDPRYLINLDTSRENAICIGCAGIAPIVAERHLDRDPQAIAENGAFYALSLTGYEGGHSGDDIHLNRGNPTLTLNRIVGSLPTGTRFVTLDGGNKRNGIPREAKAVIYVPREADAGWQQTLQDILDSDRKACQNPNITLIVEALPPEGQRVQALTAETHGKIANLLNTIPNGALEMSVSPDAAKLSSNLGIVHTSSDPDGMDVSILVRGLITAEMEDMAHDIQELLEHAGFAVRRGEVTPGWNENADNPLVELALEAYRETTGKDARLVVFHSFIEPGAVSHRIGGNVSSVSFGPNNLDEHTPRERVGIRTFEESYKRLCYMLHKLSQMQA